MGTIIRHMDSTGSQAIDFFFGFREKLDAMLADAWQEYGPQMQCKKGCFQCCRGDFRISLIEAHILRQGIIALPQETRQTLGQNLEQATPDKCPLLGPSGACQAYEQRPVLCRIFGYPVRIPAKANQEEHIATCELNFQDMQNTEFQAKCFDKATIQNVLDQISGLFFSEAQAIQSDNSATPTAPPTFTVAEVLQAALTIDTNLQQQRL